MKTNGATWKRYLASWPEGQWFDDSDETIDGKEQDRDPADLEVVEFTTGVVYRNERDPEGVSLVSHFRKWLKTLTMTTLVAEVPTTRLEELEGLLKSLGGKRVS